MIRRRRNRNRRTVKRAMTEAKATEVRRKIENAQKVALTTSDSYKHLAATDVLDRYGVTVHENVTQSRKRVLRYWRVYAS